MITEFIYDFELICCNAFRFNVPHTKLWNLAWKFYEDGHRIIKEHILAQNFTFTKDGIINGVDSTQLLSQKHGKIDAVKSLKLDGTIIAIGDGWTDYQIKEAGLANFFIAFTESVYRKPVTNKGDFIASSFNEVINYIELIKKQ